MKTRYKSCLLAAALCLGCGLPAMAEQTPTVASQAQGARTIKCTVVDENGDPVIGASVRIQGSKSIGAVTDLDGNFSLSLKPSDKVVITYIGYKSLTAGKLKDGQTLRLEPDANNLDDVVVVGYGTMKKRDVTGAVEVFDAEELQDLSVSNLSEALVGLSPSLHVDMPSTGRPGENATITIRQAKDAVAMVPTGTDEGGQPIGGDANPAPLYVIDDFISTEDAFNDLDIDEVESISILKDASAAVYGAYGAYGVILVKTKRGKSGKPRISYGNQIGWTDAIKHAKMLSSYDYGRIYNAAAASPTTGRTVSSKLDRRLDLFQADELEQMKNTNYDLLDRYWSSALTQRHSINMNGGTERATYFTSVSYYTQDGNIGKLDYDRWNYRAGVNAKIGKWTTAALTVSGDYADKDSHMASSGGSGSQEDYNYMLKNPPYVPDQIGDYPIYHSGMKNDPSFNNYYNYQSLYRSQNDQKRATNSLTLQGQLEHDFSWFKPLKGLRVRFTYSKSISNDKLNRIRMENTVYRVKNRGGSGHHLYVTDPTQIIDNDPLVDYDETTLEGFHYTDFENFEQRILNDGQSSYISREMTRSDSYQMNLMFLYNRRFGKHNVSGTFSIEKSENESENVKAQGTHPLSFTDGQSTSLSDDSEKTVEWTRSEGGSLAYIGRLNYSYADKYLFEFLMRSQASTKFSPKNYWGFFPGVSAGWIISDEKWFPKKATKIDFLKLRASFGLMGRDNVQAWRWLQLYSYNEYGGAIFGTNAAQQSARSFQLPEKSGTNPNLRWDKNYKSNFGIDMRMLGGRLEFTFDGYYDWGRQMFDYPSAHVLPGTVGIYAAPENFGEMNSWGFETIIGWRQRVNKDLYWSVRLGTGYDDNKVLETSWAEDPQFDDKVKGKRSDRGLWGLSCIGMFRSYQEIEEYFKKYNITSYLGKTQNEVEPGMLIYEDIRGPKDENGNYTAPDGVIDSNVDLVQISHRESNPYHANMSLNFVYKSFSLQATFQAEWGAYTLVPSGLRGESFGKMETTNISTMWRDMYVYDDVLDASGNVVAYANRDGRWPNIQYSSINSQASTFWKMPATEVYLRNLSIAYNLPQSWVHKLGLSSVRFNMTAQNLLSFYNGIPGHYWDNFAGTYGSYPQVRKITFGLKVSF